MAACVRCFLVALLLACGGRPQWTGDPALYGVDLVIDWGDPGLGFVDAVDFRARLKRVLEEGTAFIGRDTAGLAGLRIVVRGGEFLIDDDPSIGAKYDSG